MSEERSCIIIDQHPVVRLGLRRALPAGWDCDEAADIDAAEEMIRSFGGYDVAIVELRRAKGRARPGTNAIRRLHGVAPGLGIIASGPRADHHAVEAALRAGALAFVSALASPETVRTAAVTVADGRRYVDPDARSAATRTLTRRQLEVLQHLADGATTEQTAKRLGLSEQTVRTHAKAIFARLDANGRAHAVALGIRTGLIE